MEGVTILNTIESMNKNIGVFSIYIIVMVLVISIGLFGINYFKDFNRILSVIIGIACAVLVVLLYILCPLFIGNANTRYEVTVDENVKMKEFIEHYKIIEIRDDVFVVEEVK